MTDITQISAAALSYLGDAVLELLTREKLVKSGVGDAGVLNRMARDYVTAASQSAAYDRIAGSLTEEEERYFRRGRNHTAPVPKSASVAQYRRATGMEALFAYLWLTGQSGRAAELFDAAFPAVPADEGQGIKETI